MASPVVPAGATFEDAACFRCEQPGESVYNLGPYGVRRCHPCDIVMISPRLDLQGRQRLYDDPGYFEGDVYSGDGADGESGLATWWQNRWARGRLATLAAVRERSGLAATGRLLEVGCAYGLFVRHALQSGWDVTAMDVSEAGVAHTATLGVEVHRGDIRDVALPPASFDAVVAWDVIEHVEDPGVFAQRAHDLLTSGGTLALSLPNAASVPARALGQRWWTLRPSEHIWHLSPRSITAVLTDAGLVDVQVTTSPFARGNEGRLDSMVVTATRPN